jgi:hypothetical protein
MSEPDHASPTRREEQPAGVSRRELLAAGAGALALSVIEGGEPAAARYKGFVPQRGRGTSRVGVGVASHPSRRSGRARLRHPARQTRDSLRTAAPTPEAGARRSA